MSNKATMHMVAKVVVQNERGLYLRTLNKDKQPLYTEKLKNAKDFPSMWRAEKYIEVYKLADNGLEAMEVIA